MTGMVARVAANFGPLCHKDLSSGVSSFLEWLITHLFWIHEVVKEVAVVLTVLVVLEAILQVVVEVLKIRFLSSLIWVFLYCRESFLFIIEDGIL